MEAALTDTDGGGGDDATVKAVAAVTWGQAEAATGWQGQGTNPTRGPLEGTRPRARLDSGPATPASGRCPPEL